MKKAAKKVSINEFERVSKEQQKEDIVIDWYGVEVTIRPLLSLTEMLHFVKDVVDACFTEDGQYIPEAKEFAMRYCTLVYYANFRMPQNVEKQYWLVFNTDAVDVVFKYIDDMQIEAIEESIERKIDYICNSGIREIRQGFNELISRFASLEDKFSGTFDQINPEDIQKLTQALGDGTISGESVVSAYIDKMKEDAVKQDETPETTVVSDSEGIVQDG